MEMVLVIENKMRCNITLLLLICSLLVACQPNSTMTNKTSKNEKALAYLSKQHNVEILNLNVIHKKNAGSINDDSIPYDAKYTTEELGYRNAVMSYLDAKPIKVQYDTYSEELACLTADQNIEKEGGDIPFVIYNRMMDSRAEKLELNKSNMSIDELQEKIFAGAELQILVLVTAPDILENKGKYEEFHIEIMRRLKEQHIEKADLDIVFLDDKANLEDLRTSPEYLSSTDKPIKEHTLQRWATIHNNKWYDMVKDHPDKVLKYGKIFSK